MLFRSPIAGRESRFPNGKVGKAEEKKRVAIIGAGPAGLEAAYIAAQRGHSVEVYEATDRLCGGQLRIASSSPCKDILQHIPDFFRVQLGSSRALLTVSIISFVTERPPKGPK